MSEQRSSLMEAGEGEKGSGATLSLSSLAAAAGELLEKTIKNKDPDTLDFKDVKQLTGALKDLAELMEEKDREGGEGGIVIRIEGDVS